VADPAGFAVRNPTTRFGATMSAMQTLADLNRQFEADQAARNHLKWIRAVGAGRDHVAALLNEPSMAAYAKAVVDPIGAGSGLGTRRLSRALTQVIERLTLLGRLSTVSAPPHTGIPTVDMEPEPSWVADAAPIPVARFDLDIVFTALSKVAVILAFTRELLRSTDDRMLSLFERLLVPALRLAENRLLLSTDAAVENERPAGLLYNLSALSTGSPGSLDEDFRLLWDGVRDGVPLDPHSS
jgi:hypothetical protein